MVTAMFIGPVADLVTNKFVTEKETLRWCMRQEQSSWSFAGSLNTVLFQSIEQFVVIDRI